MNYKASLHKIKAFVFDFDGVMTNGSVFTLPDGQTVRYGNVKDGYALQYAAKKGYTIILISGASSNSITHRMKALGVQHIHTGVSNKLECYRQLLQELQLQEEEVLVMGDDIPDYEILSHCGVATCPADAAVEVKEICDYISIFNGGEGCVRDVLEQTLRLQGIWFHPDAVNW